ATKAVLPRITINPDRGPARIVVNATAAPLTRLNGGMIIASTPAPAVIRIAWPGPRSMKEASDFISGATVYRP
ncbi:hypothetical protein, partial [Kaarinaea lacus]